jgi:pimeloyl-ACP methyl ester carboxylesterase
VRKREDAMLFGAIVLFAASLIPGCGEKPQLGPPPTVAANESKPGAPKPEDRDTVEPKANRLDEPLTDPEDSASAHLAVKPVHRKGETPPQDGADAAPPKPEDRWMKLEQYDIPFQGKTVRSLRIGKPDGRAVLLLHGAKFNARTWIEVGTLDFLAKNGCRAMAIDLPGFGGSKSVTTKPEDFLYLLLPYLDLKKPVLVFPSMSGGFAFPFVTAHKEMVAGLVPIAPVGIDDYAKQLKGLDLPTLILWGEKDDVIPITKADTLKELLPNSTKIVIAGAGHPCYQDQPQQFHAALLKFLKSLDAVPKPDAKPAKDDK